MAIKECFRQGRGYFVKVLGIAMGAAFLAGACITPALAAKAVYPAERITWIIPVKPGGSFDMMARLMAPYLSKYLMETKGAKGGSVVIKNVVEAGGSRAYTSIYNGKPDGYTIGYFNAAFVADNLMSKSDIDCNKYTFIMRTHVSNRVINIRKKGPFKTWAEMLVAGKEKELKVAAGNFGRGHYIAGILVKDATKMPARLIAFPGSAENANALVRGDVDMSINLEESSTPLIESGEFGVLTTLSETSIYPGVLSIAQLGYPELAEPLALQFLLIAPPNLPKDVSDTLIAAAQKVFQNKEFLAKAERLGIHANPLYGADAARVAKGIFKFYEDKTPTIAKYLK
jgi:tripartite-type tricarboxylate transporter receptor subunit TctC